jgi:serine/threonine protein kinase
VSSTAIAGRYRVERALGDGAMAKVVLARDTELDRLVALKLLEKRYTGDDEFRARFTREARLAAALSHPNVVTIFDAGEADGTPYIVMEYVEGESLDERLGRERRLSPDQVRALAIQVCAGLEHAHSHGLVHRDLKPSNLIVRSDGTVKIADFGIARGQHGTELTETGTILGTAAYLAPEQAEGHPVTPRTDLYGLGVVLYELLTGARPWQIASLADLGRRRTEPLPPLPAETPSSLRQAIERCLAPDPDDRPASAAEVAELLGDADEEATLVLRTSAPAAPASRPSPPRWAARRARLGRPLTIVLAAFLVLVAALAVAALTTGGGGGRGAEPAQQPPRIAPVPDGATPAEDARNLAEWLRENAGR